MWGWEGRGGLEVGVLVIFFLRIVVNNLVFLGVALVKAGIF